MKILIVDDHVLIREALGGVLRELKRDSAVVIEAPDARGAMRQLEANPDVDLLLLDLGLPTGTGLTSWPNSPNAIRRFRWRCIPPTRIATG
jgi:DNA-binding NarL/FixJ family response regulator